MKSQFIEAEKLALLRSRIGYFNFLPFQVSLETGMRIGDVVALTVSQLVCVDGRCYIQYVAQKTGKSACVEIAPLTFDTLRRCAGRRWVFPSPTKLGRHITRQALWARVKRACKELGFKEQFSPHSFRKCFAVELRNEKGVDAVQAALQHTSKEVTAIYAFADGLFGGDPEEPLRRKDLPVIAEYILAKLRA